MKKSEVVRQIVKATGVKELDVIASIDGLFFIIKDTLADGEDIHFRGFGSFVNKKRAKKLARNISTNTAIMVDAHYVPAFKPAKAFVQKVKAREVEDEN